MRTFLLACAVAVSWMPSDAVAADSDPMRPNILYLYVDDMGWGSIGPNGQFERRKQGLPYVRTPSLDRLAREGVNFSRAYGCHVCSPARSSQQTGFHQGHTFADRNDPDNAKKAIRRDDITIGECLAPSGYATGYWGKWGYGGSKDQQDPQIVNVQTLPTSHGYQDVLAELHHVRAHTFFQPTLWKTSEDVNALGGLTLVPNRLDAYHQADFPSLPARQSDPGYPDPAYCDDHYAFAALDFVRRGAARYQETGQPFFGLLACQIPHAPFGEVEQLPDWDAEYRDDPSFDALSRQTVQWAAMVTRIDAHIGNLLDALDDPNGDGDESDSIAAQTLVIFQSDNGGPRGNNLKELDANGGLSGSKGSIAEGGIRVPLLVRWPDAIHASGNLRPDTSVDDVVDVTDWLPTFCQLAGTTPPLGIDGVSLVSKLTGRPSPRQRPFLIHEASDGQSIIQGRYKLIRRVRRKGPEQYQLFDLQRDPGETTDVLSEHPELVDQLRRDLLLERVTEPKGFAVTYHEWTGNRDGAFDDADRWSDYVYENDGVQYIRDSGAPQASWIAKIVNASAAKQTVTVDADASVLALHVEGTSTAPQVLAVPSGRRLDARNELRLGRNSVLRLDGGSVQSRRAIEVQSSAVIKGSGDLATDVVLNGDLQIDESIQIHGDLSTGIDSRIQMNVGADTPAPLIVNGKVSLAGTIQLQLADDFHPQPGQRIAVARLVGTDPSPSWLQTRIRCSDATGRSLHWDAGVLYAVAE
ncbi:sulfatase-like hydrolase/transferase [Crateriforma conspicua]|uniref:sulfatase-like hydrolase/transferase n=1 Tax=Crateriforma conspicua TaxID=2527996 RepID=UPI0011899CDE|nr:sulfatase-like hydrolase/transferase [Crateriforma conspicua]QDV62103.1 Arylsulfatase [Crateriforma conspicua]